MYSQCIITCPYYRSRDKLTIRCECGNLSFHDGTQTSDYVARHCGTRWQSCTIAASNNRYYERLDQEDEEVRRNQAAKA